MEYLSQFKVDFKIILIKLKTHFNFKSNKDGIQVKHLNLYKIESDIHDESEDELQESFEELAEKKKFIAKGEIQNETSDNQDDKQSKKYCAIQ